MNKKQDDITEKALNETDGVYEEYSTELADADDVEAQKRADAADRRARSSENK
ncbi:MULTISPECIES: YfhD family protein [Bacillus]|uniref:YfhD family protein n=1 Tax=Bacillus capparidis TaxID=1840411 RepID=A0ABS4D2A1_9BACI|nr:MULTISPECIES: YfhD family protein [Bacillus]MBP1083758.1 hypothetical protein [Bacillus capparidis]MED1098243.1 YfhD family protein [Bacillus capparidis]